jgi:hypothetical protein
VFPRVSAAPPDHQVADGAVGSCLGDRAGCRGEARAVLDRPGVEQSDPGQLHAPARLVEAPEELVARAHCEQRSSLVDGLPDGQALDIGQVRSDQLLMGLPAVADDEDVDVVRVDRVARPQLMDLGDDAAPAAAPDDRGDVPAVAVGVHDLRVEVAEPELAGGHRYRSHSAPT